MAFWAVEVKPGEPYVHESSLPGRLRITQATLGNLESVGWSTIECSVGGMVPVRLCALNSTSGMYRLDLEFDDQNVVFSVNGDSSVHLAGYYKIPNAAANVQVLVKQSQEADDRETTHLHDIAQERNGLDTEVRNVGTNQMVQQAGLNINTPDAAANVQSLVTQSEEADDGRNQIVRKAGLKISDGASLGSGHLPGCKEDVRGPIDELEIKELKLGDCNAEMASDGKKVEVRYIGKLKNGEVFDSFDGGPAIYKFTIGADRIIDGWHQGIKGMRVGGKRRLTIPPSLAYKDQPQNEMKIPANSWLVYDIELLKVSEPGEGKPKKKSRLVNHH